MTIPIRVAGSATRGDNINDAGVDYTLSATSVTFPADTSTLTQTFDVTIKAGSNGDGVDENEETIILSLDATNIAGVSNGTNTRSTISIEDSPNDRPVLRYGPALTVDEGDGYVDVPFTLNKVPASALSFVVNAVSTVTASSDDFVAPTQNDRLLTFIPGGPLTQNLRIRIVDDNLDEGDETIAIAPGPYHVVARAGGTLAHEVVIVGNNTLPITITDNDVPKVSFMQREITVSEGVGTVRIIAQIDISPMVATTFSVTSTSDTATLGDDFVNFISNPSVPMNSSMLTFTNEVMITDDMLDEDDESFKLVLSNPSAGLELGSISELTINITDNDTPAVSFSSGTATVAENVTAGTVTVTVQLDISPRVDLTIPVITADDTAFAGHDYTAVSSVLSFAAGATGMDLSQTVSISITDDSVDDDDEEFKVSFGGLPPGVVAGTTDEVTVTITDDDNAPTLPTVSFDVPAVTVAEGAGTVSVNVTLSATPAAAVTVLVSTMDGTAGSGFDYNGISNQMVTFATTDTGDALTKPVTITILNVATALAEVEESFMVIFSTIPATASAGNIQTVEVTITDDDIATVSFDDPAVTVAEGTSTVTLDVTLSTSLDLSAAVTIPVRTVDASARAIVGDYTAIGVGTADITFAAGASGNGLTQQIMVTINEDSPCGG